MPWLLLTLDVLAFSSYFILRHGTTTQNGQLSDGAQRPRSWHCSICQTCVRLYDHHSLFAGRCIGAGNTLTFAVTLLLFVWQGAVNGAWCAWVAICLEESKTGLTPAAVACIPVLLAVGLASLAGAVWAAKTLHRTLRRWLAGFTAREWDAHVAAENFAVLVGARPKPQNLQAFLISPHRLDR